MNLTRAQKVRLGVFVATGLVLVAGGLLTLAGLKVWERRDEYTVLFKDNVSGLENNAQVKYQGLRVGRVEKMQIAEKDPNAIAVTLSLEKGTKLYQGSTATLELSGITGLKIVNLKPGDPRQPVIPPGSELQAGESLIEKITGRADVISEKVERISNQIAEWTSDKNRENFEKTLGALAHMTTDLDKLLVDIRVPLTNTLNEVASTGPAARMLATEGAKTLQDVRGELNRTLAEARGAIADARKLVQAADPKVVHGTMVAAQSALTSLDKRLSSQEFGALMAVLRETLSNVTKLLQETDVTVRASREDFVQSLAHLRQATEDLREFSRIIAQDPSILIRGKEASE